jgi:hypothetical protein
LKQTTEISVLYRGINEFRKRYQPRTNLVKDENCDQLAVSQNILNRWKNYFCQLLNVNDVNDVRQTELQTAEPFVPEPNSFVFEIAVEKLKRYH